MDMVSLFGNLVIITKETIKTIKETGMAKCTGMMGLFTKEIGNKVFKMARVFSTWLMGE
jgi:hypothetical protein